MYNTVAAGSLGPPKRPSFKILKTETRYFWIGVPSRYQVDGYHCDADFHGQHRVNLILGVWAPEPCVVQSSNFSHSIPLGYGRLSAVANLGLI